MIAYLKGEIHNTLDSSAIIVNDGIGYEVFLPLHKLSVFSKGTKAELYIYDHITESGRTLFGFANIEERKLFLLLISVSGVGPKTAIQFFDVYSQAEIISIIQSEDIVAISKISGIGKKSAERIVLELKDKINKMYGESTSKDINVKFQTNQLLETSFKEDIVSAFVSLGYSQKEAEELIRKNVDAISEHASVEESIKFLLTKKS